MYDWAFELWICMGGEKWQYFPPRAEREGGKEREVGSARARESAYARGRKTRRAKQAGHVYEKKSDRFNAVAAVRCLLIVEFQQFHFLIVLFLGTFVEGFGDLLLKVYHCCCCCCWGRFRQVFYSFWLVFEILIAFFFLCSLASVLSLSAIVCSSTSYVVLILSCVRIFVS
jgi:hypothetical protein